MGNTIQGSLKSIDGSKQFPELNNEYLLQDLETFAKTHKVRMHFFKPGINVTFLIGSTAIHLEVNKQKYWFIASGYFAAKRTFKCVYKV